MILMIDNYDSFTYNLVQLIGSLNPDIRVVRNDALTVEEIRRLAPSSIILSPGPGYPKDAGVCEDVVKALGKTIPILGVCLGHQAICEVYGATVTHAKKLMHGKKSRILINNKNPIFQGLPEAIDAARYHSLAARRETVPEALDIIAEDETGEVMSVAHRENPIYGLQFHPESVLTPQGNVIIRNFLTIGGR
ncbi:aminodeoxychorismate/anthranilate synthase component II [Oscillospiraceae bacterium WX1]